MKHKDLVILASDGILDNMFDKDILECLKSSQDWTSDLILDQEAEKAAICLAERASKLSHDTSYDSPFAQHARQHNKNHPGGKVDDITVIVGQVRFID